MSPTEHDQILSLTSHLPHVIAYNIVKTSMSNGDKQKNDIIRYSAGGLRDFTRIAASDPIMWKDIFIDNSDLIIDAINKFSKSLDEFKKAITEPENVIAPTAAPKDISIKLASLIFPTFPKLKAPGFKKAAIATNTAAKPTKL